MHCIRRKVEATLPSHDTKGYVYLFKYLRIGKLGKNAGSWRTDQRSEVYLTLQSVIETYPEPEVR